MLYLIVQLKIFLKNVSFYIITFPNLLKQEICVRSCIKWFISFNFYNNSES